MKIIIEQTGRRHVLWRRSSRWRPRWEPSRPEREMGQTFQSLDKTIEAVQLRRWQANR